jgi:hypothetical protein
VTEFGIFKDSRCLATWQLSNLALFPKYFTVCKCRGWTIAAVGLHLLSSLLLLVVAGFDLIGQEWETETKQKEWEIDVSCKWSQLTQWTCLASNMCRWRMSMNRAASNEFSGIGYHKTPHICSLHSFHHDNFKLTGATALRRFWVFDKDLWHQSERGRSELRHRDGKNCFYSEVACKLPEQMLNELLDISCSYLLVCWANLFAWQDKPFLPCKPKVQLFALSFHGRTRVHH